MEKFVNENDLKDLVIRMERRPCFGACPVYDVTVYGDGRVIYVGNKFVKEEGERTGMLDTGQLERLSYEFERAGYFDMEDEYADKRPTDFPITVTSININGKKKTVRHCHGDFSAPKKLSRLENLIDELTETDKWVRR